jgi:uncharacterized protein YidB (DUF937 family)
MSSDGGLGGLLGGLFGGKGGIGKVLQDLLGGPQPGAPSDGKLQIPTPENPGGPIQPPPGQAAQPGQGMPQGQPGTPQGRPGQGVPQGQPGQGVPQGQPGMPQGQPGGMPQGRPGQGMPQGQPGQGVPQGQPGMPQGQPRMPKPQPPGTAATAGAAAGGAAATGGLGSLLDRLRKAGLGDQVNSWLSDGPNKSVDPQQISQALGPQQMKDMAQHAGVSETELSQGLAKAIPEVVNDVTPHGEMPTQNQLQQWMNRMTG